MKLDLQSKLPLESLFILFLIIGGNFLGALFPCRIQKFFTNNVFSRHILGFLTLIFFVILDDTDDTFQIVVAKSVGLYIWFIFVSRMSKNSFILLMIILATIYILSLYKNNNNTSTNAKDNITSAINALFILAIITTVGGFLVYLGKKKIEFKKKFNYRDFFFGVKDCNNKSPKISRKDALKAVFNISKNPIYPKK